MTNINKTFPSSCQKTYAVCPHCGESAARVDHLIKEAPIKSGTWNCHGCGGPYSVSVSTDKVITTVKSDSPFSKRVFDLLELPPQQHSIYFVVERKDWGIQGFDPTYYYNEHTCPTNWLSEVHMVIDEDNTDPHGLFRFVKRVPKDIAVMSEMNSGEVEPFSTFNLTQKE